MAKKMTEVLNEGKVISENEIRLLEYLYQMICVPRPALILSISKVNLRKTANNLIDNLITQGLVTQYTPDAHKKQLRVSRQGIAFLKEYDKAYCNEEAEVPPYLYRAGREETIIRRAEAMCMLHGVDVNVFMWEKPSYGRMIQYFTQDKSINIPKTIPAPYTYLNTSDTEIEEMLKGGIFYNATEIKRYYTYQIEGAEVKYSSRIVGVLFTENAPYLIYSTGNVFIKIFEEVEDGLWNTIKQDLLKFKQYEDYTGVGKQKQKPMAIVFGSSRSFVKNIVTGNKGLSAYQKDMKGFSIVSQKKPQATTKYLDATTNIYSQLFYVSVQANSDAGLIKLISNGESILYEEADAFLYNTEPFKRLLSRKEIRGIKDEGNGITTPTVYLPVIELYTLYNVRKAVIEQNSTVHVITRSEYAERISQTFCEYLTGITDIETQKSLSYKPYHTTTKENAIKAHLNKHNIATKQDNIEETTKYQPKKYRKPNPLACKVCGRKWKSAEGARLCRNLHSAPNDDIEKLLRLIKERRIKDNES